MRLSSLLIFAAAATLSAQTAPGSKKPIFVGPEQLVISNFLPDPPAPGSPRAAAEMTELHRLQDARTEAQIAAAKADDSEEDMFVFKTVLGEKFVKENLPATAALSSDLHNDEGVIVNPAKTYFHRIRPFFADSTIKPVCKINSNQADYAYPSGHSTTGYLEAFALALIVPEKREAILERADEYAHNRVVCGVHYASDTAAGKQVAMAMIGVMLTNPKFQQELAAARREIRTALGLTAEVSSNR